MVEPAIVPEAPERPWMMTHWTVKHWVAASIIVLTIGLCIEMKAFSAGRSNDLPQQCQTPIQSGNLLSWQQLTQLLMLKEGSSRKQVQALIRQPYCQLPSMLIRAKTNADRHLWQVAPDASITLTPDAYGIQAEQPIWVVILYEGDRYLGYRFVVQS